MLEMNTEDDEASLVDRGIEKQQPLGRLRIRFVERLLAINPSMREC